jgi:hypothetical protein
VIDDPVIVAELRRIAKDIVDGVLLPEEVVRAARPEKSPLHSRFDWEDSEAAHNWRLHQARNLIRVTVTYVIDPRTKESRPMRVFVSLTPDRVEGGYRVTVDVLSDREQRKRLLQDALDELERFQAKYAALEELAEIFTAISRLKR